MSESFEGPAVENGERAGEALREGHIMAVRGRHFTGAFTPALCGHAAFEAILARLDRLAEDDGTDLIPVKESTVRRVLRGSLADDLDVHLKLFRAVRITDRARDALGGARGRVEFERLVAARARGLPAVEPLAAGSLTGSFGSRSFLLTRTLDGATALPRTAHPSSVAHRVGELLRRVHDAGLLALDLHAGNLLEAKDGSLHLCDLTSARLADPLDARQRAHALAFFCADLPGGVRDPAAAPLLSAYRVWPELLADAARRGIGLRSHALVAFGRRATRPCRHTVLRREPDDCRWFEARGGAALHDRARLFAALDPPLPRKTGRRGAVWLLDELVVKQRPAAAARRLFQAAYLLEFAGVPVPPPVALRTRHGVGLVFSGRIDAPDLRDELRRGSITPEELLHSAAAFGTAIGRLHAHGLRNRDMKLENLVREPVSGRVTTVDLDGIRRKSPHDRRGQAADLGRLLAAFREHAHPEEPRVVCRFWRCYVRARQCLDQRPDPNLRRLSAARARAQEARRAIRSDR